MEYSNLEIPPEIALDIQGLSASSETECTK